MPDARYEMRILDSGCVIRDTGFEIRDAGFEIRDGKDLIPP